MHSAFADLVIGVEIQIQISLCNITLLRSFLIEFSRQNSIGICIMHLQISAILSAKIQIFEKL